jgi:hypothetical protein
MPWCDTCDKYWTPASMRADGSCPTCGAVLATSDGDAPDDAAEPDDTRHGPAAVDEAGTGEEAEDDAGVPWHFKLLIALLVVYLVYRFVEIGIKIFT